MYNNPMLHQILGALQRRQQPSFQPMQSPLSFNPPERPEPMPQLPPMDPQFTQPPPPTPFKSPAELKGMHSMTMGGGSGGGKSDALQYSTPQMRPMQGYNGESEMTRRFGFSQQPFQTQSFGY